VTFDGAIVKIGTGRMCAVHTEPKILHDATVSRFTPHPAVGRHRVGGVAA
jgi:hypothetical protein